MPIFIDKNNLLYHKSFSTKEKLTAYVNEYKNTGKSMLFSVSSLFQYSPKDDINYLCSYVKDINYFTNGNLSLASFPKNWEYEKIISYLLDKINNDDILIDSTNEFGKDIKKYGSHTINEFEEPYIQSAL